MRLLTYNQPTIMLSRSKWCYLAAIFSLMVLMPALHAPALKAQSSERNNPADDISGAYTFLQEGEVLQLTVEDGKLSGYISRYGDSDSDRGQFIEQFFDKTLLEGDRLSFNTKIVHGVGYEFSGVIAIGTGKKVGEEGYRALRGKLVEHSEDANGNAKSREREVEFKSFPAEVNR